MIDLEGRHIPTFITDAVSRDEMATIISCSSVWLKYYDLSTRQFFRIFLEKMFV